MCDKRCSRAQNRREIELFALAGCLISLVWFWSWVNAVWMRMDGWMERSCFLWCDQHRMVRKMDTTLCEHDGRGVNNSVSGNMPPCDAVFPTNVPDAVTMERYRKTYARTRYVCVFFVLFGVGISSRWLFAWRTHKLFSGHWSNVNTIRQALQANWSRARIKYTCITRYSASSEIHSHPLLTRLYSHLFWVMTMKRQTVSYVFGRNSIWAQRGKWTHERMRSNDLRVSCGCPLYVKNGCESRQRN